MGQIHRPSTTCPELPRMTSGTSLTPSASGAPTVAPPSSRFTATLENGRLVSECEAVEQSHFEDWINLVGWPVESIHKVDMVCQVGNFWKL